MNRLPDTHPTVFEHFKKGMHPIRRSDRKWAGLSTDLVIEQELMRSLKTTGGLTRGSRMTENQRNIWVISRPSCAQVNNTMQNLTRIFHKSSEQIKDISNSRIERDSKDLATIKEFLCEHNPFSMHEDLINISNGMHASSNVNVERSKDIGLKILRSMDKQSPTEFSFKQREQAVTLAVQNSMKIKDEIIQINPNLIFQRLAAIASKSEDSLSNALKFELCTYPTALFDSVDVMKVPKKTQLTDAHTSLVKDHSIILNEEVQYVLDGGALLYQIPWEKGLLFSAIINKYKNFVTNKFGAPIVIFDGYTSSSTKDITHLRRRKGMSGVEVSFNENMKLNTTKDLFLSNNKNKETFIHMLGEHLVAGGCKVVYHDGDADLEICFQCIESSKVKPVALIGDDTDLLVLLLYHAKETVHDIVFMP